MMIVRVLRSGLSSTIQDLGRPNLRHYGVPVGGALDRPSHELANRLVGNLANAATVEMTLTGDELEWPNSGLIAITGADMSPVISNEGIDNTRVPQHCPVMIRAGTRIRFGAARRGCRCYLAVAGGFDVPVVMGSRSTYLRAGVGGVHGRALKMGDEIQLGDFKEHASHPGTGSDQSFSAPPWFIRTIDLPSASTVVLRTLRGSHFTRMTDESQSSFLHDEFEITPQSDRMGYRITGPRLRLEVVDELSSEGLVCGTIQLPPDGNPILLMADSAPTGGYHRIGQVITADISLAAQLRPGQSVAFREVSLPEAQQIAAQQRQMLENALLIAGLTSPAGKDVGKL